MERCDDESGSPVSEAILKVVRELWAIRVRKSSGIDAPTSAVVVVKRGDLELVKVTCEGRLSSIEGVVASCVDATLESVLYDNIAIHPYRPTWEPVGEMVLEVKSDDTFILRCVLS